MTDRPIEAQSDSPIVSLPARHADKYNDPRVKITGRGIAIGVAIAVIAAVAAWGSIQARRTRLGETTKFWGAEVITALQLGERIELVSRDASELPPVDLTSTPGLGHLRRALLDERNFDWATESTDSVASLCSTSPTPTAKPTDMPVCIQLRLTDPTGKRFELVEIDIDLAGGWVGPSDGSKRVQATEWVQPKLRNWFKTIMTVSQKRYDVRE